MKQITTIEEVNELKAQQQAIILKHSNTCPISMEAYEEFEQFTKENPTIPSAYLVVQQSRELSAQIAENTGVRHESPQVILFKNEQVIWHTSHRKITIENLQSHTSLK